MKKEGYTVDQLHKMFEKSKEGEYVWLPLDDLELDTYQREPDPKHVAEMLLHGTSKALLGVMTVVEYQGRYKIVDGGHRKLLLKSLNFEEGPCILFRNISKQEAAGIFRRNNKRRRISSKTDWNAARDEKDPEILATDKVMRKYNWGVSGLDKAKRLTQAPATMMNLNHNGMLEDVLKLIEEAWPDVDSKVVRTGPALGGIGYFLRAWRAVSNSGGWKRLVKKMKTIPFEAINMQACGMAPHLDNQAARARAFVMANHYNKALAEGSKVSIEKIMSSKGLMR